MVCFYIMISLIAYSSQVQVLDTLEEEEIKLSEEELAQIEREKQEALERQQRIEAIRNEIANDQSQFNGVYDRAVNTLCQEMAKAAMAFSVSSSSSSSSDSDSDDDMDLRLSIVTSASLHEQVDNAKKDLELARSILESVRVKKQS